MTATRGERLVVRALGGILAAGLTLMFAVQVGLWTIGTVHRSDHRVVPGPVEALVIDSHQVDVRVVAGSGPDVTIDSRAEGTLRVPRMGTSVEGSHVRVTGGCPLFSIGPCRTTAVVHVPPGVPVQVRAGSGDVSASGLSARVRLRSSSGDVDADGLTGGAVLRSASGDVGVRALAGTVSLQSSSGDVSADDLAAGRVTASTNSGDVSLDFTAAPTDVTVRGHAGDVQVVVPARSGPYAVDVATNAGSTDVRVPKASRAPRRISAHTNSGDVLVETD